MQVIKRPIALLIFLLPIFGLNCVLAESETSTTEKSASTFDPFIEDDGVIGSVGYAAIPGIGALSRNFGPLG